MKYIILNILCLLFINLFSQNEYVKITGKIKDLQTKEYLQYVNIYLKNSNIGTVTNNNGEYILSIKKENLPDSLIFSYIGYNTYKIYVIANNNELTLDAELKSKINKINEVEILEKKPDPRKILKQTYSFLKEHQNKIYKVDYYARECIRYNNKFVYSTKGFLQGIINNKVSLGERSKLITGSLIANDSLLFLNTDTPPPLNVTFQALYSRIPIKSLDYLQKKGNIKIDTVIFYSNSKMYVLNIDYNFTRELPSNYDMIVNQSLTEKILKQIKNNLSTKSHPFSYKLYIEVIDEKYFLKKTEKIYTFLQSKEFNYNGFVRMENYFKTLEDNSVIPNFGNCFSAYIENDTIKYYNYNNYLITKIDTINNIDKEIYKCVYNIFPMYLADKEYVLQNKKDIEDYNNLEFNYIKQDSLELLINNDLK